MGEFTMPSLGADMDEGTLQEWLVGPGDPVRKGDPVAVVETAKSTIEVECFETGMVGKLLVEPGTTVPVGTALALIEQTAEGQEKREKRREPEKAEAKRPVRPSPPTPPPSPNPHRWEFPRRPLPTGTGTGTPKQAPCSGTSRSAAASTSRPFTDPGPGGMSPEPTSNEQPQPPEGSLRRCGYGPPHSPDGSPPNWTSTWPR